ncbi:MAG: hypothetical protein H0T51_08630, partial [Pirellulales bacterium]|nr:hypothetical protein [Pirellulales bacterium]
MLTVVLAIVFAVIARLPEFGMQMWFRMIGIGVVTACFALLCLWIVFGRSRLWMRIVGGALGVAALEALLHLGEVGSSIDFASPGSWTQKFLWRLQWEQILWWWSWNLKTMTIALAAMLSTLTLARFSGWFRHVDNASQAPTTRRMVAARIGLSAVVLAVAAPLFFVLYELLTPPLPKLHLPTPNGYDDFIAAGKLLPDEARQMMRNGSLQSIASTALESANQAIAPTIERIAIGMQKDCQVSNPYADQSSAAYEQELGAILNGHWALMIREEYIRRTGTPAEHIEACLQSLRFGQQSSRGSGYDPLEYFAEQINVPKLRDLLGELDADTSRLIAHGVSRFDRDREPHRHRQAVQAIVDQHSDWKTHLQYLMTVWSGKVPHKMDYFQRRALAETRLLIVDAALQAFLLENRRPPRSLAELTPHYFEAIPTDPFDDAPLRYKRLKQGYKIYSVGYNGIDEDGASENGNMSLGDIVFYGPHAPPLWMRLRDGTVENLKSLW